MEKLISKPCKICSAPVFGRKRPDRNAYHYSPRCEKCAYKTFDPEIRDKKRRILDENRRCLPVGSTRSHNAGRGLVYTLMKTDDGKWEYEHRVVASEGLGRPLKSDEQVHHKNTRTTDNRQENLAVLSPKEHRLAHGLAGRWSIAHNQCADCGTTDRKHLSHGLCSACYQRRHKEKVGISITCAACGKPSKALASDIAAGDGRFCSRSCAAKSSHW